VRLAVSLVALSCIAQPQLGILEQVRENSLKYEQQLPNFICKEVVHRYEDAGLRPAGYRPLDTVTAQLAYFQGREEYTNIRVNGDAVPGDNLGKLRGVMAEGEFGSLLKGLFEPESRTTFEWKRRKKMSRRTMSIFQYNVKKENSRYRIFDGNREYTPAYRGEIDVDEETNMVMRLVLTPYDIPSNFVIRSVSTTLDYEFITVAGKKYLLPVKAEITSEYGFRSTRNVEEFLQYRKFGTETNLTFDTPEVPLH